MSQISPLKLLLGPYVMQESAESIHAAASTLFNQYVAHDEEKHRSRSRRPQVTLVDKT
jgi:hypothetical protein